MEKLKKEIAQKVARIASEKKVIQQANENLLKSREEINKLVEDANKIQDKNSDEYKKLIEEASKRTKSIRNTEKIYRDKEKALKRRIETDKARILGSLAGKKARIENVMGVDLKNADMVALNKEEDRLRNSERLVRVSAEEFEKLSSEQQSIVRQAQNDYANITKRLKSIKEVKAFFKNVGDRNAEEVLKDIDSMIKNVSENYSFENIDKVNHSNTKTTEKDFKDDKSKKDNKDSKEQKDKQNTPRDDVNNLESKMRNNEKDIAKYKKLLEKFKDNPKRYQSCERMIEELEAENEEIRRKLNIKGPDKKEDKTNTTGENDKKEDKTNATGEKNKKEDPESLKKKFEENLKKMSQYADLLNRYKDDPVTTKNIMDAINKLKQENEKIRNTLNIDKDKKENTQLANNKNKQSERAEIEPKEVELKEVELEIRPTILFDIATGDYIYANAKGETKRYDFFTKEADEKNNGKYKEKITKKEAKFMREKAMKLGLTKKQAKEMDLRIYRILAKENVELLGKYIESLKGNEKFDKGFDLIYDLRKRNREIKRFIGYINQARVSNIAKKHAKLGIATMYKDKSRALAVGLLSALGISAALGLAKAPDLLNRGNEPTIEETGNQKDLHESIKNKFKGNNEQDKNVDARNQKDIHESIKDRQSQNEEKDEKNEEENENIEEFGYVKVAKGAMLYRDPTDELRIKNGIAANEKVTIKNSSGDKIYEVTKIGYYTKTGEYVAVEPGESLEEALAKKGLDISFIQKDNSTKMYHVVADGIAQWVHEDDIEHVEVKTDKFGNRVDKTEEEKAADEAMKQYYNQKDNNKSQNTQNYTEHESEFTGKEGMEAEMEFEDMSAKAERTNIKRDASDTMRDIDNDGRRDPVKERRDKMTFMDEER